MFTMISRDGNNYGKSETLSVFIYYHLTCSSGGTHPRTTQSMAVSLNDAYRMWDTDEMLHSVVIISSVNTTAAAAEGDDDASQCDVIAPHPEHLLLVIMGSSSSTGLVL